MLTRFSVVIPLMLSLVGCDSFEAQNEISFETAETVYSAGEQVDILLENNSKKDIGLNLCFAFLSLERQVSSEGWESLSANLSQDPDTACNANMLIISPAMTNGGVAFLPDDQPPGVYSIVTDIEIENNRHQVRTNVFEIK